jgi:signal transduction histidine kinase
LALIDARLLRALLLTGGVLLCAGIMVAWLSTLFQRIIARPILGLAETADRIAREKSYATRVSAQSRDEIGILLNAFNHMLAEVQLRDTALQAENAERRRVEAEMRELNASLEVRVRRRTAELEESNVGLAAARDAAESADRAKSAFLATMSHELRTPLNAIIGYSELLTEISDGRPALEFVPDLQKIRASGQHLLSLIDDILDLSKIEAGQFEVLPERIELQALVDEIAATARVLARRGRNRIDVANDATDQTILSDRRIVRQVLLNLIGNACKFTTDGRVSLRVCQSADPDTIAFVVADTGIGIPADALVKIFDEFYQADGSTTRRVGGTGLGLAIARRLAGIVGGTLTVESTVGEGSTFRLDLPTATSRGERGPGIGAGQAT